MEIVHGSLPGTAVRVGLLPGGFNPPTVAHLALLRAAAEVMDAVVAVVPRAYPHKTFDGATLDIRLEMLRRLTADVPYAVALADQGLFIDITREFRRDVLPGADVHFVCGRDAAERITCWDYGAAGEIERQLCEYKLLVAARQGDYEPPAALRHGIVPLGMTAGYDDVSSTMVRDMLEKGHDAARWQPLVPESIREIVQKVYGR
jgi:cytidyltransferase-like protein